MADFVFDAIKLASDASVASYKLGYEQGYASGFQAGVAAAQKVVDESFAAAKKAKEPSCAT